MDGRIEQLRQQLRESPASRHFYQLGELLRKEEQNEEAAEVLRQGLQHHPRYVAAWVSLGRALVSLNAVPEAEKAYATALELDPENAVAARLLGQAAALRGDWLQAIKKLKLARALSPLDDGLNQEIEEVEAKLTGGGGVVAQPAPPMPEPAGAAEKAPPPPQAVPPAAVHPAAVPEPAHEVIAPQQMEAATSAEEDEEEEHWEYAQTVQLPDTPPEAAAPEAAATAPPPVAAEQPVQEPFEDQGDAAEEQDDDEVSHITAPIPVAELRDTAAAAREQHTGVEVAAEVAEELDEEIEDDLETQPGRRMLPLPSAQPGPSPSEPTPPRVADEAPGAAQTPLPGFDLGMQEEIEEPVMVAKRDARPGLEIPAVGADEMEELDEDLEEEAGEDEDLPMPTLTLARLAIEQGDMRLAERTLQALLARDPSNQQAADLLTQLQHNQDRELELGVEDVAGGEPEEDVALSVSQVKIVTLQRWLEAVKLAAEQRAR